MSAKGLSSRAIIGSFYRRLSILEGSSWIGAISMMFNSDQESEEYKWLGQVPAMREWVGGRQAKGFRENGITIENKHYEATLEVLLREVRRDKTGQLMVRVNELARRTNTHWASLLSTLIINGESTVCYDGQFFFDTDHSEGDSGTQSNDIQVDISTLPVEINGVVTAPSIEEMQLSIVEGCKQIIGFVDDEGEPMNEDASQFLVMTPLSLWDKAKKAVASPAVHIPSQTNMAPLSEMNIRVVPNVRLDNASSPWTDKFAVFRTDSDVKPFITQQETPVGMKSKAEGSEFEFDNDAWQFGVDTWRNVGYGYWQDACLVTMI